MYRSPQYSVASSAQAAEYTTAGASWVLWAVCLIAGFRLGWAEKDPSFDDPNRWAEKDLFEATWRIDALTRRFPLASLTRFSAPEVRFSWHSLPHRPDDSSRSKRINGVVQRSQLVSHLASASPTRRIARN